MSSIKKISILLVSMFFLNLIFTFSIFPTLFPPVVYVEQLSIHVTLHNNTDFEIYLPAFVLGTRASYTFDTSKMKFAELNESYPSSVSYEIVELYVPNVGYVKFLHLWGKGSNFSLSAHYSSTSGAGDLSILKLASDFYYISSLSLVNISFKFSAYGDSCSGQLNLDFSNAQSSSSNWRTFDRYCFCVACA